MTNLTEALAKFQPVIERSYRAIVLDRFKAATAKLGPFLENVYNDWDFARVFNSTIRQNVTNTPGGFCLDEAKLSRNAQAYAVATIAEWESKITSKLTDLDRAEVKALDGCSFRITGYRGTGHDTLVEIVQSMILNVSSKGKLFNQFPARIYVNGKFTSEKKYKEAAK